MELFLPGILKHGVRYFLPLTLSFFLCLAVTRTQTVTAMHMFRITKTASQETSGGNNQFQFEKGGGKQGGEVCMSASVLYSVSQQVQMGDITTFAELTLFCFQRPELVSMRSVHVCWTLVWTASGPS